MKVLAALALPKQGPQEYRTVIDAIIGMHWPEFSVIRILTVLPPHASPEDQKRVADGLEIACQALEAELNHCEMQFEIATGDPRVAILETALDFGAELIFVGTRKLSQGLGGIKLMLAGSVSQSIMMHAHCPVIVLKSHADDVDEELQKGFQSVLVPVDGSIYAKATLKWITALDWGQNTRFKLITAVSTFVEGLTQEKHLGHAVDSQLPNLTTMAMSELEELAIPLITKFGADRVTTQVQDGDPREIILDVAESWKADLIIVSTHGRSGLRRMLLGSVCQAMAAQAPCSVAVVRGLVSQEEKEKHDEEHNQMDTRYDRGGNYGDIRPQVHPGGM